MAKPGTSSRLVTEGAGRSAATKQGLVEAAIETLKAEGFAGASARAIAGRAGCNQALVFYHFGFWWESWRAKECTQLAKPPANAMRREASGVARPFPGQAQVSDEAACEA